MSGLVLLGLGLLLLIGRGLGYVGNPYVVDGGLLLGLILATTGLLILRRRAS